MVPYTGTYPRLPLRINTKSLAAFNLRKEKTAEHSPEWKGMKKMKICIVMKIFVDIIIAVQCGAFEMIDTRNEELLTLSEAAKLLPAVSGRTPFSYRTLWNWKERGMGGKKLETVKVGGLVCTTRQALAEFMSHVDANPKRIYVKRVRPIIDPDYSEVPADK